MRHPAAVGPLNTLLKALLWSLPPHRTAAQPPLTLRYQVEAFDTSVNLYGQFAFLLWRSVYITKQVGGCAGVFL